MPIYKANDKYAATLTAGYTAGQNVLSVSAVPDNVPTIVVAAKGTANETVFAVTGKTVNSLTGVSRLRGANVDLDATTPVTCLNNQEFINQFATAVFTPENLKNLIYAEDGGSSDAYAISLDPAPASYVAGLTIAFRANTVNTGPATLNVNGLGAKTIKKNYNEDLANSDIKANQVVVVVYDGTNFQLPTTPAYALPDGAVTTAKLADANVTSRKMKLDKLQNATSTTNLNTASTSYIDYTGLSITFTPDVASHVLVLFLSNFYLGYTNTSAAFRVDLDGTPQAPDPLVTTPVGTVGNVTQSLSGFLWIPNVSAASHTIKIQAKNVIHSGSAALLTTQYGSLIVIPFAA